MPISHYELENLLKKSFPDGQIECIDLAGDDDHWQVHITSSQFKGLTKIAQHKLVQKAVSGMDIHALAIKTNIAQ